LGLDDNRRLLLCGLFRRSLPALSAAARSCANCCFRFARDDDVHQRTLELFLLPHAHLFHAYLLGVPYNAIAFSIFLLLLLRLDRVTAWCFLPYIIYLFYANIWGYRIWKLNPGE